MNAEADEMTLSKGRIVAGLQCLKRVYLERFAPGLATPLGPFTQSLLATGRDVGALARRRFPGGALPDSDRFEHAVAATTQALGNRAVPAIYEAAFLHGDLAIRADVLRRRKNDSFDLIEVKAATKVSSEHELDVAVQLHVLEAAGVPIRRAFVMHLNRAYVYEGGEYDLKRLFVLTNVTKPMRSRQKEVRRILPRIRAALGAAGSPAASVRRHCDSPRTCPFRAHCHRGLPLDPFGGLPRMTEKLRSRILEAGIEVLDDLPLDFPSLSLLQRRALEATRTGRRVIDSGVSSIFRKLRFPIHFVDFETFAPALPLYAGTRPYEAIPFQWSDHVLQTDGSVRHLEFLHEGGRDPRREFASTLIEATKGRGSVVVYSNFECQRLEGLEATLPDLAPDLCKLRKRLFDLLPVMRGHVYDPGFGGSFSIKAVLPAIVPGLGYEDLSIQEGGLASVAFAEMNSPATAPARRATLREDLLAYCGRDTQAMVEVFKALRAAA